MRLARHRRAVRLKEEGVNGHGAVHSEAGTERSIHGEQPALSEINSGVSVSVLDITIAPETLLDVKASKHGECESYARATQRDCSPGTAPLRRENCSGPRLTSLIDSLQTWQQ